ncbi:sulfurtransferase [Thaumasiovibrio sp. DFM-14]|uniref:sulfurtransferase n=1 Tax=Thaumasiovibrio sp. DFM-14 TaxID=3384792 RepID=UPI0039A3DEBC
MKKSTIALGVIAAAALIAYPTYRSFMGVQSVTVDMTEQAQKLAEYANSDAFITPQALAELMNANDDVVVIGALNPVRGDSPIRGSHTMWRPDYSASNDAFDFGGMRNTPEEMENVLGNIGATADSTIVVYAANAHHDAARLYWQIKMLGHEDVRYLDGGLNAWAGANLPTGNANPRVESTVYTAPNANKDQLATLDMVLDAIADDEWVIVDTRGMSEHDGSQTLSGAFGPGMIPNSIFIEWTDAANDDTTLKSAEELQAIYGDIIDGKKVISYCQSGVRSAHTTMVLKEVLGAEEVYNYDGSWIEWSHAHYEANNADVKVANGQS